MLHRTDMHYYNIEEIGMRNRYYRTAAIKAAVIYLVGTLRKKEKKRRNLIVFARFLWIFARIYSTINERIRTRILLEEELEMKREDMIWSDRKRNWHGGCPQRQGYLQTNQSSSAPETRPHRNHWTRQAV